MMTVRCYLAPSAIEGLGVFNRDPIARGQEVWRFDPVLDQIIPISVIQSAPEHIREFIERYAYEHPTDRSGLVLDADEGRFMNHSDAPNLDFASEDRGFALVDIPADTELTCDYACFTVGPVTFQPPRHRVAAHSNGMALGA